MNNKNKKWIEAKKKFRLSDMHIQMARELGMIFEMVQELRSGVIGSVSGNVRCADMLNKPEHWRE